MKAGLMQTFVYGMRSLWGRSCGRQASKGASGCLQEWLAKLPPPAAACGTALRSCSKAQLLMRALLRRLPGHAARQPVARAVVGL